MLTGKTMYVPDRQGPEDSVSFHGLVRRYVGGSGESFVGFGYSHGYSREELEDRAELLALDADTAAGERRAAGASALAAVGVGQHQPAGAGRARSRCGSTRWAASVSVYF